MPDFTIGPQLDGQAENPVFLFPPVIPLGAVRGQLPFRLFSTSFRLRPNATHAGALILGATLSAAAPGVLHVVIDASSFYFFHKFTQAAEWLADQAGLQEKWKDRTRDEILADSVSAYINAHPELFQLGPFTRIVVEVPPANLTDP